MKSKKRVWILFFVCISLGLCGCRKQDLGNSYIQGQDHQYMFQSLETTTRKLQARGDKGSFFSIRNYIYYLEDGSDEAVPLCNKADCLHDKETNEEQKKQCNAYFDNWYFKDQSIAYYDGYLYCMDQSYDDYWGKLTLYRVKEDGSEKEKVYEWEDPVVLEWVIHRGYFFYIEQTYPGMDSDDIVVKSVKVMDLNHTRNIETIYDESELEGVNLYSIGYARAYGNYFYFQVVGDTFVDDTIPENYWDYRYSETFSYNILTKELTEVKYPDGDEYVDVKSVEFYKDKLLVMGYDVLNRDDVSDLYMTDLDGKNPQVIIKNVNEMDTIQTDEKYLYISNGARTLWLMEEPPVVMNVYDDTFCQVDTFTIPFSFCAEIGCADYLYFYIPDEEDKSLYKILRFNKSLIGNMNGKEIVYDVVLESRQTQPDDTRLIPE